MNAVRLLLPACLLAAAGPASGQFSFDPAASTIVGSQPSGLTAADFDGDGDVDLATTVGGPDRIVVLVNDGSGLYSLGPASLLPNSSSPQDLIAGDFNSDGHADVAVAVRDPQGSVHFMANNGAGSFSLVTTAIVQDRPRGLSASDIEGDGDLDLAVANRDSNSASVLTNDGAGTFSVQNLPVGGETRATTFGDFDGDTDPDLAVTDHANRSVATFANTAGVFAPSMTLSVGGVVRPDGVTAADLDGDGDMDIAVAVSDQTLGINQAMVFVRTMAGFDGPFGFDTGGTNTSDIVAADLDCDGVLDLVTANADSANVSLLRGLGGATYGAATLRSVGLTPDDLVATDLDGDTDPDVATANRDSNDVSVLRNQTCSACPWDLSGDGIVGINDLIALLSAWGPNPGHPADFDGDGIVGINDLIAMLGNWGGCP